jgi:tRNA modification GTPase
MEHSTIAAIATPGGRGGIGIIKLSGSKALSIASAIFTGTESEQQARAGHTTTSKDGSGNGFQSHRLYYGHIHDPENGWVLDEVLLSVMKAPRSYTREDVVEINAHGGQAAVNAILELVLRYGARLAEPGEFTKRAYINGRIDLTQAEAVIDVINARSAKSLIMATGQVSGSLKRPVEQIRTHVLDLLALVEAGIDFPDEVSDIFDPTATVVELQADVVKPLQRLIRQHSEGNLLRDGLKIAVVGRPNVGKSSLLNCLVQRERAIVTAVPGTTRDAIEESLNIKGYPVVLVDTAGQHATADPIELIGIQKAVELINRADLILLVVEADRPLNEDDHQIFARVKSKPTLVVINKIDLVEDDIRPQITAAWGEVECAPISALYDRGVGRLKDQIVEMAFGKNPIDIAETIVPNLRQKLLLEESLLAAEAVQQQLETGFAAALAAIHLKEAIQALGQILGTSGSVDVLDQIFSRFCIGK